MRGKQIGHVFVAHGRTEPGSGVVHTGASPRAPIIRNAGCIRFTELRAFGVYYNGGRRGISP